MICETCGNTHGATMPGLWQYSEPIIVSVDSTTRLCDQCQYALDYQAFLYHRAPVQLAPDEYGVSDNYDGTIFEGGE